MIKSKHSAKIRKEKEKLIIYRHTRHILGGFFSFFVFLFFLFLLFPQICMFWLDCACAGPGPCRSSPLKETTALESSPTQFQCSVA